jgi:hypothetical protein
MSPTVVAVMANRYNSSGIAKAEVETNHECPCRTPRRGRGGDADPQPAGEVDEIRRAVVANSWDTNRMMKRLYLDQAGMSREAALTFERSAPYGMPRDMEQRLQQRPGRDSPQPT